MKPHPVWSAKGPAPPVVPLAANERADLIVVGAGIQGLSAALYAARAGLAVRIVEAGEIGAGASGVNGGQVIPGLKHAPAWLAETFGERAAAFASGTADAVFSLIASESLAVPHARAGWIQAAHTETALASARDRVRQWQARGADVGFLDAADIAKSTGATGYLGGWIDRRAGVIDPLAFTRGLARLAVEAGGRIATTTRIVSIRGANGLWTAGTADGRSVAAPRILVATNAHSDALVSGLARSIVWLHSFQIATAPLPPAIASTILPGGQAVSDSRRILVYFRKTADGRLMLGGRGPMRAPRSDADWAHLQRALVRLYPALAGIPIERRWFGRVAMTPDSLPHIHEPEPGLLAVAGCNGRGVALMTALGPHIAQWAATGDWDSLPFPVTPVRPIPFHAIRHLGVAATIAWNRLRDALET
ncbi:MAG: NAD(P)/FAD-dependent oxidoreductase [Rhizobiaceae bacterium]